MAASEPRATDDNEVIPADGDLASVRPDRVLAFCERVRFSGTLGFKSATGRGILPVLNGVPEIDASDEALNRALDDFLVLDAGHYSLTQLLPELDGATRDGDLALHGSLEKLTAADLLRYCESAGLSGTLTLTRDDRSYTAKYQFGDLETVMVDDRPDADWNDVFSWNRGTFQVRARSVFRDRVSVEPPKDAMLKTLEVALTDIMARSAKGAALLQPKPETASVRPPSILRGGTQPFGAERAPGASSIRPSGAAPPRPRSVAPPPKPDSTVRVIFVEKASPTGPSATQHAASKLGAEVLPLDPASQKFAAVKADVPADAAKTDAGSGRDDDSSTSPTAPAAGEPSPKPWMSPAGGASVAPSRFGFRTPRNATEWVFTAAFGLAFAASAIGALAMLASLVR